MKAVPAAALIATLAIAGCGRDVVVWNPTTWFGSDEPERLITLAPEAQDPRPLAPQVTAMHVDRYEGGIIVRATGLPPTQGYWAAELVPRPVENGVLVLGFYMVPPVTAAETGTPRSREITAAYTVSSFALAKDGITRIVVKAQNNERSARP